MKREPSGVQVGEALASELREASQWLADAASTWPPGRTFLARRAGDLVAVARLGEPSPGDGYHGEQVRSVHVHGRPEALTPVLQDLASVAARRWRLEAESPKADVQLCSSLAEAGLVREVVLPEGWGNGDLCLWGRPAARRLTKAPGAVAPRPRKSEAEGGSTRLVTHDSSTRAILAVFLEGLVPGRAYPPGTILSGAEQVETRRPGDLDAAWVLALDSAGAVVGGAVLEPDSRTQRRGVRRVHVDVREDHRGCGVASALLRGARRLAGELGACRVEADPRSGSPVQLALEAAGFLRVGVQLGAWRMRTPTHSWDEDVVFYSASTEQV